MLYYQVVACLWTVSLWVCQIYNWIRPRRGLVAAILGVIVGMLFLNMLVAPASPAEVSLVSITSQPSFAPSPQPSPYLPSPSLLPPPAPAGPSPPPGQHAWAPASPDELRQSRVSMTGGGSGNSHSQPQTQYQPSPQQHDDQQGYDDQQQQKPQKPQTKHVITIRNITRDKLIPFAIFIGLCVMFCLILYHYHKNPNNPDVMWLLVGFAAVLVVVVVYYWSLPKQPDDIINFDK